jgi:hypothetical protein
MSGPTLGTTQPCVQWILGFFPGSKVAECEVNDSTTFSAEVKKVWSYTSAPSMCLHGMDMENVMFLPTAMNINLFVVLTHTQSRILFVLM